MPETIVPETVEVTEYTAYPTGDVSELRYPLNRTEYYAAEVQFCVYRVNANIGTDEGNAETSANAQGEVASTAPGQTQERDDATEISLYLPAGLSFNDGVSYDNVNIGMLGVAAEAIVKSGGGGILEKGIEVVQDFADNLSQGSGSSAGKIAQARIASPLGEEIGGAVSGALRVKENPQTRVLFGSVPIRTFEFSFQFLPTSLLEAETIIKIIKTFRTELYPEGIAKIGNTYNGYNYPDVFRIKFLYDGKEIEDAPKLLDCYLQGVQTNYNPSQMAFFKDGKFSEITMALSFTETRTLFRQDIVNEGY